MMLQIFTIYDEKAHAYLPPFFLPHIGQATRTFSDCINSADHQFGKHPHDYTLFALGHFDDNKAEIILADRKLIANGVEYLSLPATEGLTPGAPSNEKRDETQLRRDPQGGNSA